MSNFQVQDRSRLDPLTSLRFFAAAMIVMHHAGGRGLGPEWPTHLALAQGVSFFFVLSGFVLAYNYAMLPDAGAVKSFYVARFARIWPSHCATTLLYLLFINGVSWHSVPADVRPWVTLSYATLTHAWVPLFAFGSAYNTVSWSISTEFFFYLAFPLLVLNWERTGKAKIAVTAVLAVAMWIIASIVAGSSPRPDEVRGSIGYFNPLARLFEFSLGIAICRLFRLHAASLAKGIFGRRATLLEISVLFGAALGLWLSHALAASPTIAGVVTKSGTMFLETSGFGTLFFSATIFVFALGRGAVSRVLTIRPLVFLGEISFALYMVHTLFLLWRQEVPAVFDGMSDNSVFALYWLTGLMLAVLLHFGIEKPCQALIRGWHSGKTFASLKASFAPIVLCVVAVALLFFVQPSPRLAPKQADLDREAGNLLAHAALFEPDYRLDSVRIDRSGGKDPGKLRLDWTALRDAPLDKSIAVHLLDDAGRIVGQRDIAFETAARFARKDERWVNLVPLAGVGVSLAKTVAIGVYNANGMARIGIGYPGGTDWDGQRLLVPFGPDPGSGAPPGPTLPLAAFDLTDANWVNGISRHFAGFFVTNRPGVRETLRTGRKVRFADGTTRTLVRVEPHGPFLNVFVDGPLLDGAAVGHPHPVMLGD